MSIAELFGPKGPLAEADPDYEERPQQVSMAEAVAGALSADHSLVVEAGTGVGKSLAYLLPGALWAAAGERRIIISTYTRTLQEQLMERELPLAAKAAAAMGVRLRYAMLMGSENYLCVQRLSRLRSAPAGADKGDGGTPWALVDKLSRWAETAKSGHRNVLPELVPQPFWRRICRDTDVCLGANGPYWDSCLYRKDKEKAERAHILVVNHALLLSGARLPSFDALIIDEAHNLEDAGIGRYGISVSEGRYFRVLSDIGSRDGRQGFLKRCPKSEETERVRALLAACWTGGESFFDEISRVHGFSDGRSPDETISRRLDKETHFEGHEPLARLEEALAAMEDDFSDQEEAVEFKTLQIQIGELRKDVALILKSDQDDYAYWVQRIKGRVELYATPLEVGQRISEALFSRGVPTVLTSATLTSGRNLGAFKRRFGLDDAEELVLDSPFDYEGQAALLILDDLPPPKEERAFLDAVADRCERIIDSVPGGVFLLFSSWKALRRVHELLKSRITDRPLWTQGTSGNETLLEDFIEAGDAVLLGVDTFWQGVDVQGAALSCVVMVKLPFPQFGSPVEDFRREYFSSMGLNYFDDHSLPKAVMKFRQGFGRLIRSASDRGAVVVLDSRVVRSSYGSAFLDAVPKCRRLDSLEELGEFFKGR